MGTEGAGPRLFGVSSPEFDAIEQFFAPRSREPGIILGIGDDAALTEVTVGRLLVTATDSLVEGTHFRRGVSPESVGHRALAVNLSDLAAMGARARWASLALSLERLDRDWLEAFSRGWFDLADRWHVALIGGDTVRGPLAVTVTVQGEVEPGKAVRRSGARPGDLVYATGCPGAAAAARVALDEGRLSEKDDAARPFLYPEPRLNEGASLGGIATAMIDVSDGLAPDLSHLLHASNCGADLHLDDLPMLGRHEYALSERVNYTLYGGEDYELVFTLPPSQADRLAELSADWGVDPVCIGQVEADMRQRWHLAGAPLAITGGEFRHFTDNDNARG